ncbi:MAG: hypothetical protein JOZ22_01915 [Acidobacteriia bacterium]|nr:hypothetical protein [Terriglobia bacterium]
MTLLRGGKLWVICAEEMVDSWRSVIGSQPHLAQWFAGPDGEPDDTYKSKGEGALRAHVLAFTSVVALGVHKAVILHVGLWSRAYAREGLW